MIGITVILAVTGQYYIWIVADSWGDVAGVVFIVALILVNCDASIHVLADQERLTTLLEHLIRNAKDATIGTGSVEKGVRILNEIAVVSISDTGEGMSAELLRDRLIRPFDSTKGSHAMGICPYQTRDYVRSLGGKMEVSSKVGVGMAFLIRVPVSE